MNSSKSMRHLVDEFKVNGRSLALLSLTLASGIDDGDSNSNCFVYGKTKWRISMADDCTFFWRAPFLVNTFALDDHGKEEDV
jgi:hypothetical protein